MKRGSVIVDVAVDQGGVANMPGGVSRTATQALTTATLPYGIAIASNGLEEAARRNHALARGINTFDGALRYRAVADAFEMDYLTVEELL